MYWFLIEKHFFLYVLECYKTIFDGGNQDNRISEGTDNAAEMCIVKRQGNY